MQPPLIYEQPQLIRSRVSRPRHSPIHTPLFRPANGSRPERQASQPTPFQCIASRPIGPKEGNATKRPAAQYVIEPQNELDDPDASLVRQMQHEMQLGFRAFSSQLGAQLEPLVKLTPTLQVITAQ